MIFGMDVEQPLPEGWTPLEAVAVVKCLDENGVLGLVLASTKNLTQWETVGMLTAALDTTKESLQGNFIPDDTDLDDEDGDTDGA